MVCEICGKEIEKVGLSTSRTCVGPILATGKRGTSECGKILGGQELKKTLARRTEAKLTGVKSGITTQSKKTIEMCVERNRKEYGGVRKEMDKPYRPRPVTRIMTDREQMTIDSQCRDMDVHKMATPLDQMARFIPQVQWLFN